MVGADVGARLALVPVQVLVGVVIGLVGWALLPVSDAETAAHG